MIPSPQAPAHATARRAALVILTAALAIGLLPSCTTTGTTTARGTTLYLHDIGRDPNASYPEGMPVDTVSYWDGDGLSGSPMIRINLAEQKASFYRGGTLAGVSMISSGRDTQATPRGSYRIIEKLVDKKSNLYGTIEDAAGNTVATDVDVRTAQIPPGHRFVGAKMPYWMRLTSSGVGMHAGFLPGYNASRGCIRLPEHMVMKYFQHAPLGTPVIIE